MSKADDVKALAAALHAKVAPATVKPASLLKPAPVEPSMSVTQARTIMADEMKDAPPIDHDAFDPDRLAFHPIADFPPPLPPQPTRLQRLAAWFNTPLIK